MFIQFASRFYIHFNKPTRQWTFLVKRVCSNKSAVKHEQVSTVETSDGDDFKIFTISTKTHQKLPKREPLVKNFFLGNVDKEFLAHPEVIPRDDINKIYEDLKPVESYFKETLNVLEIEQTRNISEKVIEDIRQLGLFGSNIPQHLGGKGYLVSESLLAAEPETESVDISTILSSHRVVADIINEYATEDQKNIYLPKLAKGSLIATEAIYEKGPTKNQFFDTTAVFDPVEKQWILNGNKSFIVNGMKANIFLVLAQTQGINHSGESADSVNIFLVESTNPGVKKTGPLIMLGCNGDQQCSIQFNNVKVSEDYVIGKAENAHNVIMTLFKLSRLRTGWLSAAIMKKISNHLADYCINTNQGNIQLKDTELVSERLSRIACTTYATESMTYFTAGLLDEFDNQDTDLEAAILKVYSLENLLEASISAMNFMGPKILLSGDTMGKHFRNAAQLYTNGESLDNLRLYIGLSGLHFAGAKLHETIKKERNPLFHPGHILRNLFDTRKVDNPKLILNLCHDLHPSLEPAAQWLEQSILRLQMGTELALSRHGSEIVEKQIEVLRLSECITLIYAMFASVSRASRSYCIGLKHSDYEMLMASVICNEGMIRVKAIVENIVKGPFVTNTKNHQKIAKQMYKSHGYFCDHPLKYNF